MQINIDFPNNILVTLFNVIAWGTIVFFIYHIYKKQQEKPNLWKALLTTFIGIFSFALNLTIFETFVKISILPLGVWILYWVLNGRGSNWEIYRKFAWLGFWANYLFLMATFITIPIHSFFYSEEDPKTYLANVEQATVIQTHPSGGAVTLNNEMFKEQLQSMAIEAIQSEIWYQDTYVGSDTFSKEERFPYQLIGTAPKWGSGLSTLIFVENDGKGLLITTSKKQLYFRANHSFLEEDTIQ